jgi:hypothetical protein
MLTLFAEFNIKATFFVVGQDLLFEGNQTLIEQIHAQGHEIASHSMHHTQGFRLLSKTQKEEQLALTEAIIQRTIGKRPVGFRSPGWNMGDEALEILIQRGYQYDSSLFPTYMMPLMKYLHYSTMRARPKLDRTTMGQLDYMFASSKPYETDHKSFRRKGSSGFYEFPVSVTPLFRIPFFATLLLATGISLFKVSYQLMKTFRRPIIYLFHLFDFVDFTHPDFQGLLPTTEGVYVPASIATPYQKKYNLFREALSVMAKDYSFMTLQEMKELL